MAAVLALKALAAVAVELPVLQLLYQPAAAPYIEVRGEGGDGGGVSPQLQPEPGQDLEALLWHRVGGGAEGVDGNDPAHLDIRPVREGAEARGLDLQPVPRLRLPEELTVVDVAVGEDSEAVLGPLAGVVEVIQDGGARLGEQRVVPLGVLGHLEICWVTDVQFLLE